MSYWRVDNDVNCKHAGWSMLSTTILCWNKNDEDILKSYSHGSGSIAKIRRDEELNAMLRILVQSRPHSEYCVKGEYYFIEAK